jgi:hypothetical protein
MEEMMEVLNATQVQSEPTGDDDVLLDLKASGHLVKELEAIGWNHVQIDNTKLNKFKVSFKYKRYPFPTRLSQ